MTTGAPQTYSVAVTVSICPYDNLTDFGYRLGVFAAKHPTLDFDFETNDIYLCDGKDVDEGDKGFDADDYEKDYNYVRVNISLKTQADREYFMENFTGLT